MASETKHCAYCGREFALNPKNPKAIYCRKSHRIAAYKWQKRRQRRQKRQEAKRLQGEIDLLIRRLKIRDKMIRNLMGLGTFSIFPEDAKLTEDDAEIDLSELECADERDFTVNRGYDSREGGA